MKSFFKKGLLVSSLLGTYYLFVFTAYERIPFPLEMSVLPTLFLALGLLSVLITFFIILYTSISIIVLSDPLEIGYRQCFYVKPRWIKKNSVAGVVNYFMFFLPAPLTLLACLLIAPSLALPLTVGAIFLFPALFSYYVVSPNINICEDKFKSLLSLGFVKTFITFFYISFFSLISMSVFLAYISFGLENLSDFKAVFLVLGFFVFSFLVVAPIAKKGFFKKNEENYHGVSPIRNLLRFPAFYAYCTAVIFSLIPPISYSTAAKSFEFLNIGGGVDKMYYFSKQSGIDIPEELISNCKGDYCQTKVLEVVMDLGGALYVKGDFFGNGTTVVALPNKHLFMIKPYLI